MSWPFEPSASSSALSPAADLRVVFVEELANQGLEGLRQRRIGDVALVLIELAGGEQAARRHQDFVQFVDDRGFADAGIAGDQHEFGRAIGHDPIERGDKAFDLRFASIEFFGDQQPVGPVVCAPSGNVSMSCRSSHSLRHRRRSASTPAAVW